MIDANQVWDVDEAIELDRTRSRAVDPCWIEEPTSPDDVLGHAAHRRGGAPDPGRDRRALPQPGDVQAVPPGRGASTSCQIDGCRLGGVNEVLAVLLLAAKFGVPVCPHAGGVGLCEHVQHFSMFDYLARQRALDGRMIEYADHLHEHFVQRLRRSAAAATARPLGPGFGVELEPASLAALPVPRRRALGAVGGERPAGRAGRRADVRPALRPARRTTSRSSCTPTTRRSTGGRRRCWRRASGSTCCRRTASTRRSQADGCCRSTTSSSPDDAPRLAPRAVDLCRFDGALLCVPRNIDVRVLWWRTDRLERAARTWDDVEAAPGAFGFTGRESGLFGLFFELVVGRRRLALRRRRRGRRWPRPRRSRCGRAAPARSPCRRRPTCPAGTTTRSTTRCSTGGWRWPQRGPAATDRIRRSELAAGLAPARYPGGWSYAGCHGWAIPRTCGDVPGAVALLTQLAGRSRRVRLDAAAGDGPRQPGCAGRPRPARRRRRRASRDHRGDDRRRHAHLSAAAPLPRGGGRRVGGDPRRAHAASGRRRGRRRHAGRR